MIRSFLEQVTRRIVFRRRLPAKFNRAAFYVSPSSGLSYLFKPVSAIDPSLLACVIKMVRPGDIVWDIGANLGLFSLAAAVRSGKCGAVFSFEPDVWLVQQLRRTSSIQPADVARISVIPVAVAADVSFRSFNIAKRSRASNALSEYGQSQMGGVEQQQIVPTFNLDWLLQKWPRPNLIKIDVEGAELEVLQDQVQMLNEVRPIIICEVGSKNVDAVTEIFNSAHYYMLDAERMNDEKIVKRAVWNTVAIPEEKYQAVHSEPRSVTQ